ncbi:hypothetical protein [Salisediminibacterium beveridgei]|uniref:Uncharacterized protein n=1 Tax=Salisediminibacterium beveridgei TaxID=632773 RepID=A0A1D7QTS7_9BACI|nr:hypothetical protein [Salisediminibacterium beveridgei]AOM82422.1 hypothetical protein BBEV_1053 [Salisediminibacterium beveridgei]
MTKLASHPYYKVLREVRKLEQENVEYEREIELYEDRVETKYRSFPIETVMDMSYREMPGDEGILYLHTTRGVYSYMVKEAPAQFLKAYRELDERLRENEMR